MALAITILAGVSFALGIAALAGCVASGRADDAAESQSPVTYPHYDDHKRAA